MNKLQQAAKEYTDRHHERSLHITADLGGAFLAGAAYAAGEFAEWCIETGWSYWNGSKVWLHTTLGAKSTAELYNIWQQSLI